MDDIHQLEIISPFEYQLFDKFSVWRILQNTVQECQRIQLNMQKGKSLVFLPDVSKRRLGRLVSIVTTLPVIFNDKTQMGHADEIECEERNRRGGTTNASVKIVLIEHENNVLEG